MRCLACDQLNDAGLRFCTGCGAILPSTAWAQATPAPPPQSPRPNAYGPARAPSPAQPYPSAYGPARARPPLNPNPGVHFAGAGGAGAAYAAYGPPPAVQVYNTINVAAPGMAPPSPLVVIQQQSGAPPLLLRILWFLIVGLWLGALWTIMAWLLIITIIGLPLGLFMINRLPLVMTLTPPASHTTVQVHHNVVVLSQGHAPQYPLALRALYFLLIGSWASLIWLLIAWALVAATLGLGLPLAFWMFNRVPAVTTLRR